MLLDKVLELIRFDEDIIIYGKDKRGNMCRIYEGLVGAFEDDNYWFYDVEYISMFDFGNVQKLCIVLKGC